MAKALSMHGRKKLGTLQAEFSAKFPYLSLLFLDTRREPLDPELSLAAVRTTKGEDLSIVGHMKVATFEARCVASFGIAVEVAYLKDGELVRSQAEADEKTLSGLNAWCADQGSAPVGGAAPAKTTTAKKAPTKKAAAEKSSADAEQQLPAIRKLLGQDDIVAVRQGINVLTSVGDSALWNRFAEGVSLDETGDPIAASGSEIEEYVEWSFHKDVAFWALRETGRLSDVPQLRLDGCQTFADLTQLHGLSALESLSFSGCEALTSLEGIDALPALRSLDLSGCNGLVDLDGLRIAPALRELCLGQRDALTSFSALPPLPDLTSLDVSDCDNLTTIDGLEAFPALKELRLNGCDGLTSLDGLPAAVSLVATDGVLALDGLTMLSDAAATAVAACEGKVSLGGLTIVSDSAAAILATHKGDLALDALTTLSDAAAIALARLKGGLSLGGLESLSDGMAAVLARHEGSLSLNGLKALSAAAAAAFAALHIGELSLNELDSSSDADQMLRWHLGPVSLGWSFGYITIGVYEEPDAIETIGARVEETPLQVVVEVESTFTLGYDGCGPGEDVVGVIDDEAVEKMLADSSDVPQWYEHDGILHRYGLEEPATVLELPDGSQQNIGLRHWPRRYDLNKLALSGSEAGGFVHITQSYENARSWNGWKRHTLTLTEGVFDVARVRVDWEDGLVSGYTYLGDEGGEDFQEDDSFSTTTSGTDTTFYFNDGRQLIRIDFDELSGELEDAGVDATDLAAVRTYLLSRQHDAEGTATEDAPVTGTNVLTKELVVRHFALKFLEPFAAQLSLSAPPRVDLASYDSLTAEAAIILARESSVFALPGVTMLSEAAAEALAGHKGDLILDGVTTLSDAAAAALAGHEGDLSLNGLTTLSDAAAKVLASKSPAPAGYEGGGLSLNGLTTLSEAAAEALAGHEGNLSLGGLTTLSDAAAEALAGHEGDSLYLNGLTTLSDAAATALAGHGGFSLSLDGLTTLSDAAATALAGFKGLLGLNGLATLSDAAVEALAGRKGRLSLNGLTTLSDTAVEALAGHDGFSLSLGGLTTLSDAAATALAGYQGDTLYLNGLTTLSDAAATALAGYKGQYLHLDGLTTLSDAAATALAGYRGKCLHLGGLTTLSDAAATALAGYQGDTLYLNGLTMLSEAAAEALAGHKGDLILDGVTTLSDAAAKALAGCEGWLSLNGLTTLTDAAATALAGYKGQYLYLNGLTTLSDAAAKALAGHDGDLWLDGLTTLSDVAAEALAQHGGEVSLSGRAESVYMKYRSVADEEASDEGETSDEQLDDVDKILQSLNTREMDDIDQELRSLGVSSTEDEKEDEDDAADERPTFMRPVQPSPALADIIGSEPLPRIEVLPRLWAYIKQHQLQDPNNLRLIRADEKLRRIVGGQDSVSSLDLINLVSQHITEVAWADAIAEDPEHVRTGRSLPDEISAALAEASPWLTVDDLEEKRRGGDGLTAIPNYVLSAQATRAICARIRRDRIIPVWIPAELYEHFEPFHKWNKVFWLIPWVVLQNGMNGPVCVELQGLSTAKADDEFSLGIDIDRVTEIPSTTSSAYSVAPGAGTADPHWREWTLTFRDGGEVTLYEYQPDDDAGFHLDIAATIYDVRWPEIEEFRDSPITFHNPDGVGAKQFDTLEDVVAWAFEGTDEAEDEQDESDVDAEDSSSQVSMHITDCPDRFAFFNDLPRAEQAKMAFHVEVLKQLLPESDYMTDSLSVPVFQVIDLSDALLSATSIASNVTDLRLLVLAMMRGSLEEANDFAYDYEAFDSYTAAECIVHGLVLSLAAGRAPDDVLEFDALRELVGRVIEDDTGWGTRMMAIAAHIAQRVMPEIVRFSETKSLTHIGRAIDATKQFLEAEDAG